jgi:hypothetical protein
VAVVNLLSLQRALRKRDRWSELRGDGDGVEFLCV